MSDFAWIALIIILYLMVIKPLFQGVVNKQSENQQTSAPAQKNESSSTGNPSKKEDGGYVDYEEVD